MHTCRNGSLKDPENNVRVSPMLWYENLNCLKHWVKTSVVQSSSKLHGWVQVVILFQPILIQKAHRSPHDQAKNPADNICVSTAPVDPKMHSSFTVLLWTFRLRWDESSATMLVFSCICCWGSEGRARPSAKSRSPCRVQGVH